MQRTLILCGPTASGKSELALRLAQSLGGEIVNADSRQIYRGMRIGTGWPDDTTMSTVPHHLYGFLEPDQRYSAARFVADARAAIAGVRARGLTPIVVGGTGFYIEALTGDMRLDRPPADEALRNRLRAELAIHPIDFLWEWLARVDRPASAAVSRSDSYRIIRRLEGALAAREEPLRAQPRLAQPRGEKFAVIELTVDRALLRVRIRQRVERMYESGLVSEAVRVRERFPAAPALSSLGYAEALGYHDGLSTRREAIARTVQRTQRYAKRQQTWFAHMRIDVRVSADDMTHAWTTLSRHARES